MTSKARQRAVTTSSSKAPNAGSVQTKPSLTHFLCIPLGHHPALCDTWTQISSQLLASTPPIPGLHASILVPPRSLHLTLGVLSLATERPMRQSADVDQDATASPPSQHTVSDVMHLLHSLRELLREETREPLMVPLEQLDVMNADPAKAHVLWTGPDTTTDAGARLLRVCELVQTAFREAGMLQDTRPLKLHCTLVNTIYRRPRGKGKSKRVPFSCLAMRSSPAYAIMRGADGEGQERPWSVDLGTWPVEQVQLCEMGRREDGTYRSVGELKLGEEAL